MAEYANFPYCLPRNSIGTVVKEENIIADIWERPRGDKQLVVYFRGPKLSKQEWFNRKFNLTSINLNNLWSGKSSVDSIWLKHVKKMMPSLIGKIEKIHYEKFQMNTFAIHFVGHEIGGAYAMLAALFFHHEIFHQREERNYGIKPWRIGVVTFGAPRIGNLGFVKLVKNKFNSQTIFRVTHGNDWLSREFMPKGLFLHHDREFWLDYQNYDCECSKFQSLFECFGRNTDGEIDENLECNLGTIDSGKEVDNDKRSYFGIIFGNCTGISREILNY
ncbi:hypothetical protein G9A89_007706 [Geosiphon pyriformis]|nr:hypothetical protein G9A89_007706 [Geosiphon pyriformis]